MAELRQVHQKMTLTQLLEVLDDIRDRVASGDSFEGHVEWLIPDDPLEVHDFAVKAMYRIGNLGGQGSYRQVGTFEKVMDRHGHP